MFTLADITVIGSYTVLDGQGQPHGIFVTAITANSITYRAGDHNVPTSVSMATAAHIAVIGG